MNTPTTAPTPAASTPTALTIVAVRPADADADPTAPLDTILSMLRLLPGARLHIRTGVLDAASDTTRSMGQHLWFSGIDDADARGQLRLLLDRDFEVTDRVIDTAPPAHCWTGRPESGELGFVPTRSKVSAWVIGGGDRSAAIIRVWQALSAWPDGRIEVTVAHRHRGDFVTTVSLVGHTPPPLLIRAATADAFDGLTFVPGDAHPANSVDTTTEEDDAGLHCSEDEARAVLLLPLATASATPPGFLAGSPRMMPVRLALHRNTVHPDRIRLGEAHTDAGSPVDVGLGEQELLRHVHVVGATGTGKSSLLAGMIHQLAHSDCGALLLDPHGTLVDRVISELPASAAHRVRVVRADDVDAPVALNPLCTDSPLGIEVAIADMGDMFHELFDPGHTGIVGPRFVDRVAHALRGLVALRGEHASLLDVPLMLGHSGMRSALLAALTDPAEKLWWTNDVRNQKSSEYADLTAWVNSKFECFSASPALRAILGSGADTYHPTVAMDEGEIILVDLAKGTIGQEAARLLGYLLLNRFWIAAMNRTSDRRFHVIVDEAHSVMAGSLANMLSEGRKFGISVTVAHQFLGQLQPTIASALSGNVGTTVTFRSSGPHLIEQIKATGGQVSAGTLGNLPTLSAIVVRNGADDVTPAPHTIRISQTQDSCARANRSAVEGFSRQRNRRAAHGVTPLDPDVDYPSAGRPAAGKDGDSFLDDWLEKRRKRPAVPSEGTTDSAASEPAGTGAQALTTSDEVA